MQSVDRRVKAGMTHVAESQVQLVTPSVRERGHCVKNRCLCGWHNRVSDRSGDEEILKAEVGIVEGAPWLDYGFIRTDREQTSMLSRSTDRRTRNSVPIETQYLCKMESSSS